MVKRRLARIQPQPRSAEHPLREALAVQPEGQTFNAASCLVETCLEAGVAADWPAAEGCRTNLDCGGKAERRRRFFTRESGVVSGQNRLAGAALQTGWVWTGEWKSGVALRLPPQSK